MINKDRESEFDILKGIGIILVIIAHTMPVGSIFYRIIASFHMPLFFLVSGYFFSKKSNVIMFKSKFKRLIIPYLFTSSVCLFITIIIAIQSNNEFDLIQKWLISFIYGSGMPNNNFFFSIGPLWFLLALFWAIIFLNITIKSSTHVFPIVSILLLFFVGTYTYRKGYINLLSIQQGMVSVIFLYIGYIVKLHKHKIIAKINYSLIPMFIIWVITIKSAFLSIVQCYFSSEMLTISSAVFATYFTYIISIKIKHIKIGVPLSFIGRTSLLLFCIHSIEYHFIEWNDLISNTILCIFIRISFDLVFFYISVQSKIIRKIFSI